MQDFIHPSVRPSVHACIHTYIDRYIHTYIHTYTHTYAHTYMRTYRHTHTYICIYIYIYICIYYIQTYMYAHRTCITMATRRFKHSELRGSGISGLSRRRGFGDAAFRVWIGSVVFLLFLYPQTLQNGRL